MSNINSFKNVFIDEASEILSTLEKDFVALESDFENRELVDKIFRSLHTIKGSGAMFGFDQLSKFVHNLESIFDLVRNTKLSMSTEIISVSLKSIDFIKSILDTPDNIQINPAIEQQLSSEIKALIPEVIHSHDEPPKVQLPENEATKKQTIFRIFFKPNEDIFIKGINPLVLFKNLNSIGKVFCFAHKESIPTIDTINPEHCYLSWTLIVITPETENAIRDIFIFVEDDCELTISELFSSQNDLDTHAIPMIGDILLSKGDITKDEINKVLSERKFFGERAIELGFTSPEKVESALFEQNTLNQVKKDFQTSVAASSIRVQNEKLNILTNTVSELVTLQARLTQFSEARRETELTSISEYLEKLTSSLRDTVMMIRMVPVEEGFSSMYRLVRDLAKELGKDVKLSIAGGDTELDKAVIDNLKDPMMHLIRNAIDHGLETPEERIATGKQAAGQVMIKADHIGSHVIISVIDDGKGLDSQKIRSKAIEKGLATSQESLTEEDIFQFIFLPGFSTAEKTTNVSGRGVGMDVVKRNIEAIRGEVFLESKKGIGTTIKMKLPITLAIIDGLLFTVENELFVVNISSVSECLELTPEIRKAAGDQNILKLRDSIIPFVSLRDLLNIPGNPPEHEQIIIMHTHEQTMGFIVDTVQGKHQTVVKTTGRLFNNVKEITGATILGDGRIALILDVNVLAQKCNSLFHVFSDTGSVI